MARRLGRPTQYPWEAWLDGVDKLLMPEHYRRYCSHGTRLSSVAVSIRREARRRGIEVSVSIYGEDSLALRFREVGPTRLPWDEWFDGQPHVLMAGEDFDCTLESLRAMAYAAGRRRGVLVSVRSRADLEMVQIQAVGQVEPEPEETFVATERPEVRS